MRGAILVITAGSILNFCALALPRPFVPSKTELVKRVDAPVAVDFKDPTTSGGSWFMNPHISGRWEPLNVVISAQSDGDVLSDKGFRRYAQSLGFDSECFGLHKGNRFQANLGDGVPEREEIYVLRESFGTSKFGLGWLGTCWESIRGGNHLRMFRQDGKDGGTGALFLAVSHEKNVSSAHEISEDGYNHGRDLLVGAVMKGVTGAKGMKYNTTIRDLVMQTAVGSTGINHGVAVDGKVVVLTVKMV